MKPSSNMQEGGNGLLTKNEIMGEVFNESDQVLPSQRADVAVAVAVGRGDSSVQALKWTIDTLMVGGNETLHLLHVQHPLRVIQTPLGYLPFDQANEEFRRHAKQQQLFATKKLLQKYQKMCEKKKVVVQVHCMESSSIHGAVVEQVYKLGISKLVLGSSSTSRLKKILKGSKTAAIVAEHVPQFCAVMVVRKGRLSSVKDADHSSLSLDSPASSNAYDKISMNGTNDTMSETRSFSTRTENSSGYLCSSPKRDHSLPYWTPPCTESNLNLDAKHKEVSHNDVQLSYAHKSLGHVRSSTHSRSEDVLELYSSGQHDSSSTAQSRSRSLVSQAMGMPPLEEQQNIPWDVLHGSEEVTHEISGLTKSTGCRPVNGKDLSGPVVRLSLERRPHSDVTSSIGKTLVPACDTPAVQAANQSNALANHENFSKSKVEVPKFEELEALKSTLIKEVRDDLFIALQLALKVNEERSLKAVTQERNRCKELLTALSAAKTEADSLREEVDIAKQKAAVERSNRSEALAKVEELKREIVREVESRKFAERQAWKAKQVLMKLLRKTDRDFIEFSFEELQSATNNFCEDGKLGEGGFGGVYKGVLNDLTVAIKVLRQTGVDGQQQFQHEVEVLSYIHHPHIVELLGACQERACIVYDYMENGSLEDRLTCKNGTPPLPWFARFSICFEVAIALVFLHNLAPSPVVHRDLKPGNILLDVNFVSKLSDAGLARWIPNDMTFNYTEYRETRPAGTFAYMDPEYLRTGSFGPHSDVFALGIVILQVLTGKQPVGVVNLVEAAVQEHRLHEVLDPLAGEWPLPEAEDLAKLGLLCAEPRRRDRPSLETHVCDILKRLHEMAQNVTLFGTFSHGLHQNGVIPRFFVCPLSQEVMRNPHIAADGFTYEFLAIKNWLAQHDVSPMTNLKLAHKELSKDQSLDSRIRSWRQDSKEQHSE